MATGTVRSELLGVRYPYAKTPMESHNVVAINGDNERVSALERI